MNHSRTTTLATILIMLATLAGAGSSRAEAQKPAVNGKSALQIARATIAAQVELIKAQDVDKLKDGFTERLKPLVTRPAVAAARTEMATYTLEDLVQSAMEGSYKEQKTIKIMMKNGRSLTTLVLTDGKWLTDTIWFR